jgi:hypothetical protein
MREESRLTVRATSTNTTSAIELAGSAVRANPGCRAENQLCATTAVSETITACQKPHSNAMGTTMSR